MRSCLHVLLLAVLGNLISFTLAQLGTEINYPVNNDTIQPGQKIDIAYGYLNMGNGTYTVNIDLWQDNTLTSLAKNIAHDVDVPPGNSTGTRLQFYLNGTYSWSVPHGLNKTVYLTVTTKPKLSYKDEELSMRSRAVLLHVNAALRQLPALKPLILLGLAVMTFTYIY